MMSAESNSEKSVSYHARPSLRSVVFCANPCNTDLNILHSGDSFDTSSSSSTTDLPLLWVKGVAPSAVLVRHKLTSIGTHVVRVNASSTFAPDQQVWASTEVNVTDYINVTIVEAVEFAATNDSVSFTLQPHTGKYYTLVVS